MSESAKNFRAVQELITLQGHEGSVYHVARLNERKFITSSQDKTIKIWDAYEMRLVTTMDINDFISCMAVIPGKMFIGAVGIKSDYLYAWDSASGFMGKDVELVMHEYVEEPITCIIANEIKGYKTFCTGDVQGEIKMYSVKECSLMFSFKPHSDKIMCMAECKLQSNKFRGCILSGSDDFNFLLISINPKGNTHNVLGTYSVRGPVNSIEELTESNVAVATSNVVQIWDLERTDLNIREVPFHSEMITKVIGVEQGEYFFSTGYDK